MDEIIDMIKSWGYERSIEFLKQYVWPKQENDLKEFIKEIIS